MLIMEHEGHVLLVQRPPKGIWGGLWSLPEVEESWITASDHDWQSSPDNTDFHAGASFTLSKLAAFQHVFTHFRLHIQPYAICFSGKTRPELPGMGHVDESRWIPVGQIDAYGLPKPVRTLLEGWVSSTDS